MKNTPEKLNLWDRIFNRYRRDYLTEGTETWHYTIDGMKLPNSSYNRNWVKYMIVDRLTGGETIEKVYI